MKISLQDPPASLQRPPATKDCILQGKWRCLSIIWWCCVMCLSLCLFLCFLHCISALQCSWNTMEPVFEFLRFFRWTFWLWEISLFAQSRGLEKRTFRLVCVWHVSPSMDTFENLWPHFCVKMCAKATSDLKNFADILWVLHWLF